MSAAQQAGQLRELFDRLDLDVALRGHLDVALRAAEAGPPEGAREARMVEAKLTPAELAEVLGHRHAHDPDGFIAAWRAVTR